MTQLCPGRPWGRAIEEVSLSKASLVEGNLLFQLPRRRLFRDEVSVCA